MSVENVNTIFDPRDLLELIKWIKPNALKQAIETNKTLDKNYDEAAVLRNLDTLNVILSNGIQGLAVSDKDAMMVANKALELQRRIVLGHPKLKDLNGLYSMHGNVAEWTDSPYVMYGTKEQDSEKYVVRGGSFRDRPKYAAFYSRGGHYPWQGIYNVGFRVVINK